MNIDFPLAFAAGFLSFFSPCLLPMVPIYIFYLMGNDKDKGSIKEQQRRAFFRTLGFVIGFSLIFILMGSSAGFLGGLFIRHKESILKISGVIIILFGLNMLGVIHLNFLNMEKRGKMPKMKNWFSSVLMGMAFAAGWTPCLGPVLGAILFYAGTKGQALQGMGLLFVYSLGLAIPFLITSLGIHLVDRFLQRRQKFLELLPKISGGVLIVFGIMIFFDQMSRITAYFL